MREDQKRKQRNTELDLSSLVYGKVPPQNKALEETVLGAIMLEKEAFDRASIYLKPEDFYVESHQRIFGAMQRLKNKNLPIDMEMVCEELRLSEDLEMAGGPYAVSQLTNRVVSSANIEAHANVVREKSQLRQLICLAGELLNGAYSDSMELPELLQIAERGLADISKDEAASVVHIDEVLINEVRRIEGLRHREELLTGITTGYKELDQITCGWQDTDLIILAARPSRGKTASALNFLNNAVNSLIGSTRKRKGVGVFSLEMGAGQLVQRLLANESGMYLSTIRNARMDDNQMTHLHKFGIQKLAGLPIYIDDRGGLSLQQVKTAARYMVKKGCGMIIIDYLQLMSGDSKSGNREQEISTISRGLKGLAKELKVPVIALSQLSRECEKEKRTPQASDLRESGSLEQDSDVIIMLYGYSESDVLEDAALTDRVLAKIEKNRNGTKETIEFEFNKSLQRFTELGLYRPVKTFKPNGKKSFIPEANGFPKGFRNISEIDREETPF